jgi:hypothetical protein
MEHIWARVLCRHAASPGQGRHMCRGAQARLTGIHVRRCGVEHRCGSVPTHVLGWGEAKQLKAMLPAGRLVLNAHGVCRCRLLHLVVLHWQSR